ncbi:MAG: class I SAM-dependent methyltransferase [Propionicimonas sp.]
MAGQERATSFGGAVDAYELGRPAYAAEHVAWLLDGVNGPVLDLGAGSGKLTRAVGRLGFEVLAVDPDEQMLSRVAGVRKLVGTAEAIPLPDDSVAAVTVGQAWHWFDPAAAGAEITRVLVPRGRLGLIWNIRDARQPFVAALAEVMGPSPAEAIMDADAVLPVPGFGDFERRRFESVRMITPEAVEALVTSRSHWLVASPATQAAVLADVRELVATHPHSAGRRLFEFPMCTACYRADALA